MNVLQTRRKDLLDIYAVGLDAVRGNSAVVHQLHGRPLQGPVKLVAVGKAAQAMAEGACHSLQGQVKGGLVISKPGHLDLERLQALGLEGIEGGHPLPTSGSLEAGRRLVQWLEPGGDETLLFLISGGASSLLELPVAGLTLDDLERAGEWLLGSGLDIGAMNRVRKSLSRIKGGGLLQWLQGRELRALAVSDVPGDDPAVIGSGLLVPEPDLTTQVHRLQLPDWLRGWVEQGLAQRGAMAAEGPEVEIVASLDQAKAAAAQRARDLGYQVHVHSRFVDGDAERRGRSLARTLADSDPGVHVWGGETTVVLPPQPGRGGRNQHLALAAAMELAGRGDCLFLGAGTDGTDGPTEDAGALVDGASLERVAPKGLDAADYLARADAGSLLEASGDLLRTGPTGTNVMDLMLGMKFVEDRA